jgi:hypothetical protein
MDKPFTAATMLRVVSRRSTLSFSPTEPHISVALVIGGAFLQFGDPLDWVAQCFGISTKVDRMELMVNLTNAGGAQSRRNDATNARNIHTAALGSDGRTMFRIKLFGRCEGRLVALCGMSIPPGTLRMKDIEETAAAMTLTNGEKVLGVQATFGSNSQILDPLHEDQALVRLLPMNVFNRIYFQSKIVRIEKDKKITFTDLGDAVMVQLKKPWLYYDVPSGRMARRKPVPQLPF